VVHTQRSHPYGWFLANVLLQLFTQLLRETLLQQISAWQTVSILAFFNQQGERPLALPIKKQSCHFLLGHATFCDKELYMLKFSEVTYFVQLLKISLHIELTASNVIICYGLRCARSMLLQRSSRGLASYLSKDIKYTDSGFPRILKANADVIPHIKPRTLPSRSFQIYYSQIIKWDIWTVYWWRPKMNNKQNLLAFSLSNPSI
jgi:hypothetical protein